MSQASQSPSDKTVRAEHTSLMNSTVVDLDDLIANPNQYDFFTFRPDLKKLILSGAADTNHISILWYTRADGSVEQHRHARTESVYVIAGTQTDAKGIYPTGSVYFNPPGSGHEISDSTGFFVLAYASPPDFVNPNQTQDYTPIRISTTDADLETLYPFEQRQAGVWIYDIPLDPTGGITSKLIKRTAPSRHRYKGNCLLILKGSCQVNGIAIQENTLIAATTLEAQSYEISGRKYDSCLIWGLSFTDTAMR